MSIPPSADPRSDGSLLLALGAPLSEATAMRSRPSTNLVKLLGLLDPSRFGPDVARATTGGLNHQVRAIEMVEESRAASGPRPRC